MVMNKKELIKKENDLISMNEKLFIDFSIEELEQRLETDPLLLGSLFDSLGWCLFNNCACHGGTTNCTCNGSTTVNCTCNTGSSYCSGDEAGNCSTSIYLSCPENTI
jgi:hypothetical protein